MSNQTPPNKTSKDKTYASVLEAIGGTPIIRLNRCVPSGSHQFFAKIEYVNPGGSVKDRIAMAMIEDAERSGRLKPGGTIVEATSGNTGVGLALVAAVRGYKCIFVMPEKISEEKRATLRAYGARVVITPSGVEPDDPRSHYSVARRFTETIENSFLTNQYHNPANPKKHFETTGPEIWDQMAGQIDVFVGGAGTGGTLSGVGRFLKSKNPNVKIVCADPIGSILHDLFYHKKVLTPPAGYLVEGIGEDMLPDNVHFDVMDDFVQVNDKESFAATRDLAKMEGLLVGPSCGSALVAAIKYAEKLKSPSRILVMLPDGGRSYLSKAYSESWLRMNGLLERHGGGVKARDLVAPANEFSGLKLKSSQTVESAAAEMHRNGLSQARVYSDGRFDGLLHVDDLLFGVANGRIAGQDTVLHVVRSTAPEVEADAPLEAVEAALQSSPFIRLKHSNDCIFREDLSRWLLGRNKVR
jgi:cystathionine beta-synthase